MIFVFGSNLKGIHGAGSALYAYAHEGAQLGIGEGLTGNSYALPTVYLPRIKMTIEEIEMKVNIFLKVAAANPDKLFKVTQVGCGLGGWTKEDIAPLFFHHSSNCYFDLMWREFLPKDSHFWGSF